MRGMGCCVAGEVSESWQRGVGGSEFANWRGRLEKIINFLCEKKTLAVVRGVGGVKFANWKGRIEKVIKFFGEMQTETVG